MKEQRPDRVSVVFVDQIRFFSLFRLLILGRHIREIWHFEPIAPDARKWLWVLRRLGLNRAEVRQVDCHIGQVRDSSGKIVGVRLWGDVRSICKKIKQERFFHNRLIKAMASEWAVEKVVLYFEKMAEKEVKQECSRIYLVEWMQKVRDIDPTQTVLLIEHNHWLPYLQAHARSKGLRLQSYHSWGWRRKTNVDSRLFLVARKALTLLLRKMRSRIFQQEASNPLSGLTDKSAARGQPLNSTIAIHYGHRKLGFDPTERSEFFWFNGAGFPTSDVLLYGYVSDKPLDSEILDQISSRGIRILGRGPEIPVWLPTKRMFAVLWRTGLKLASSVLTCLLHGHKVLPYDVHRLFMLVLVYAYWYDFFSANRVKVNIGMLNTSVAQVLALDALNGISVAYQHSISNILTPSTVLSAGDNVQFTFSAAFDRLWRIIEAPVGSFVSTGYIYDSGIHAIRGLDRIAEIRKELNDNGARLILCFFDENSVNRWDCSYSNDSAAEDYEFLLKWLLEDQELGIVFKPKKSANLFQRIDRASGLIDQAVQTGRCKFLMSDTLYGSKFPAEAAKIADLCIGKLIGSTAALEARLAGVPTLLIDTESIREHPLYSLGFGQVVFDDWNLLRAAIEQYRASPDACSKLGDWSLMLKDLDAFCDGKATLRMNQYINWIYEALKRSESKNDALKSAAKKYAERWGDEYITMGNQEFA